MEITDFQSAVKFIKDQMPNDQISLYPGDKGVKRLKYMLDLAGNPQNKIKIIHIAGTSGKSSTSYILSTLLSTYGRKTGLYISPHITNYKERIRINNELITDRDFVESLNNLMPYIQKTNKQNFGKLSNFEILTAIAFYYFRKKNVEYAVIETGLGGLYDGTNVIDSSDKISIITRLGFDHTEILGNTIEQIALQKAGIINKNSEVVMLASDLKSQTIIERVCIERNAKLNTIENGINIKNIIEKPLSIEFDFNFSDINIRRLKLKISGGHQAENCSLALAALRLLSIRDNFEFSEKIIRKALASVLIPARFQFITLNKKRLIIDGAHNPQKMETFIKALQNLYPKEKFDFLISFTNTKNYKELLKIIVPAAKSITVTSFKLDTQDWLHISVDPNLIKSELEKMKFTNYQVIKDPKTALKELLHQKDKNDIIITGSLYLISILNLYEKNK